MSTSRSPSVERGRRTGSKTRPKQTNEGASRDTSNSSAKSFITAATHQASSPSRSAGSNTPRRASPLGERQIRTAEVDRDNTPVGGVETPRGRSRQSRRRDSSGVQSRLPSQSSRSSSLGPARGWTPRLTLEETKATLAEEARQRSDLYYDFVWSGRVSVNPSSLGSAFPPSAVVESNKSLKLQLLVSAPGFGQHITARLAYEQPINTNARRNKRELPGHIVKTIWNCVAALDIGLDTSRSVASRRSVRDSIYSGPLRLRISAGNVKMGSAQLQGQVVWYIEGIDSLPGLIRASYKG